MAVYKDRKKNTWFFTKRVKRLDGSICQVKRRGFLTKKDAIVAEANFESELTNDKLTVGKLSEFYLTGTKNKTKTSTFYNKELIINKYILPYFEKTDIEKIDINVVNKWHNELLNFKLSISRINKIHLTFAQIIDYGISFYGVRENVVRKVGSLKDNTVHEQKIQIWTKEEFETFINSVNQLIYKTLFYFLYYTGCRIGEALAITFNDVNIEEQEVHINKAVGLKNAIYTTKTTHSIRTINLPDNLVIQLKEYITYLKTNRVKYKENDLFFGISRPLSQTTIRRIRDQACKDSGVKKIRIHDLRHTHASSLIDMGLDTLYIKERLGHDDISTTLNVYSHLFQKKKEDIKKVIKNM